MLLAVAELPGIGLLRKDDDNAGGENDGPADGDTLGNGLGNALGIAEGKGLGENDGPADGDTLGNALGANVGGGDVFWPNVAICISKIATQGYAPQASQPLFAVNVQR